MTESRNLSEQIKKTESNGISFKKNNPKKAGNKNSIQYNVNDLINPKQVKTAQLNHFYSTVFDQSNNKFSWPLMGIILIYRIT